MKQIIRKTTVLMLLSMFLVSCTDKEARNDIEALSRKQQSIKIKIAGIENAQKEILTKIDELKSSVTNLASKPANKDKKKKERPETDHNKFYDIPVEDSFVLGPQNAKVTITEWMDFQ
ncbi:MAG: hypothetical protein ISR90_00995 [Candidatus Marinimicrobia bacterium]|nr:hypothetical protein [Candidatus Neomarinimicrobiota bacterium]MBL7022621.1 hypothetical protein [Candidatus Neomarinimicrobiota bacterium]MBL7109636.1 hypothetical protein [Candidatus Neomarinimicrobiota bacterium]